MSMQAEPGKFRVWQADGACRSADPELFFPLALTGTFALSQVRAAKAICARCPVRADCLNFALNHQETDGIWGGTTAPERRRAHARLLSPRP
jgi:WhiB family transcriptional regulator, redox-sensing transcriptional regulator